MTTQAEQFAQFAKALGRIHQSGVQASLFFKSADQLQDDISELRVSLASGDLSLDGIAPERLVHLQRANMWIADMLTSIQARLEGIEVLRGDVHRQIQTALNASEA